jgi:subtilisin family serine protease
MKKPRKTTDNYILLPAFKTKADQKESPKVAAFLSKLRSSPVDPPTLHLNNRKEPKQPSDDITVKVLDSIHDKGAKLINIKNDELADFRFSYPGLRIIPERFYQPAVSAKERISVQLTHKKLVPTTKFKITDAANHPVSGATIVVFTDFEAGKGASGLTDGLGVALLKLSSETKAERIYIYPEHSYWGYFRKNVNVAKEMKIKLQAIDTGYKDALRHFYDTPNWPALNTTVRLGIIDTGVGPHKDLKVTGGKNLVRGENEADYGDNGDGHGTHVGGIIAAAGALKGVAAGVELMSYRVFPKGKGASNFDIIKALDQAIQDKCDLINMSLGEAQDDEAISSYIKEAYHAGILCFAANGNDDRGAVSFPAAYSLSIAVSAMGRKGTFPANSVQAAAVKSPYGKDKDNFVADFSNVGIETDLTAPGVGIISTFPGDKYAIMDGTSMACPAAAGMAARILAGKPELLKLDRNQNRADEMVKYLAIYTQLIGFGANFEGKGMLNQNDELYP